MKKRAPLKSPSLHRVTTEYGDVVLNEQTGAYWHLNESAARVLKILTSGGSLDEAADDLVATYGIDHERARQDTEAIRTQLETLGAL